MWAKLRGSPAAVYILAGVVTWPVVTAIIYWMDRLLTALPGGLGQGGAAIGFWTASGCALVVSALIVVAGWLQSSHTS